MTSKPEQPDHPEPCAGSGGSSQHPGHRDPAAKSRKVHTKLMSEADVDGFTDEKPKLEVYCSLDGCKFGVDAHEMCAYFEKFVYSEQGDVIGIRCARPDDDVEYPLAGTEDC